MPISGSPRNSLSAQDALSGPKWTAPHAILNVPNLLTRSSAPDTCVGNEGCTATDGEYVTFVGDDLAALVEQDRRM